MRLPAIMQNSGWHGWLVGALSAVVGVVLYFVAAQTITNMTKITAIEATQTEHARWIELLREREKESTCKEPRR